MPQGSLEQPHIYNPARVVRRDSGGLRPPGVLRVPEIIDRHAGSLPAFTSEIAQYFQLPDAKRISEAIHRGFGEHSPVKRSLVIQGAVNIKDDGAYPGPIEIHDFGSPTIFSYV